jgi:threonine aldolase
MRIELRSDTFTKPTPDMLEAMFRAEVGDDVFREDPTVNLLEEEIAEYFGMESALFCASGTMSNQIAIKCHTQPGDEIICDENSHVFLYEGGGIAFNSGCQTRTLKGDRGRLNKEMIEPYINPDDVHKPRTRLVSLENTANRGGGSCYSEDAIADISALCRTRGIALHLDGARIWNAIIAGRQSPRWYAEHFDTLSVCMSKGMGAPVGSLLVGSHSMIQQARRIRKIFGGGMRQAGYLAEACRYALKHHLPLLERDHQHARQLVSVLERKSFVGEILPVETNIVIAEILPPYTAHSLVEKLKTIGIDSMPIAAHQIRMVFHLGVDDQMTNYVCEQLDLLQ